MRRRIGGHCLEWNDALNMTKAKKLSVGALSLEAYRARTMKIGLGEYMRPPNEPKLWFDSITNYVI